MSNRLETVRFKFAALADLKVTPTNKTGEPFHLYAFFCLLLTQLIPQLISTSSIFQASITKVSHNQHWLEYSQTYICTSRMYLYLIPDTLNGRNIEEPSNRRQMPAVSC